MYCSWCTKQIEGSQFIVTRSVHRPFGRHIHCYARVRGLLAFHKAEKDREGICIGEEN